MYLGGVKSPIWPQSYALIRQLLLRCHRLLVGRLDNSWNLFPLLITFTSNLSKLHWSLPIFIHLLTSNIQMKGTLSFKMYWWLPYSVTISPNIPMNGHKYFIRKTSIQRISLLQGKALILLSQLLKGNYIWGHCLFTRNFYTVYTVSVEHWKIIKGITITRY